MRHNFIALLISIIFFSGCSVSKKLPQYEVNWSKLKMGMSKQDVKDILGNPSSTSIPGKFDIKADANLPASVAKELNDNAFLNNFRYETWHYGKFGMLANFFVPSDNAYVVYFDKDSKVISSREPLTYSEKSPYYFKDVSPTKRIGCDCLAILTEKNEQNLNVNFETPILLYPEDYSVFCHYPREIVFRWQPTRATPSNSEYLIQIESSCKGDFEKFGDWTNNAPYFVYRTGKTSMNYRFEGAQPGRWRVKTINKSNESKWGEWRYFRFTK